MGEVVDGGNIITTLQFFDSIIGIIFVGSIILVVVVRSGDRNWSGLSGISISIGGGNWGSSGGGIARGGCIISRISNMGEMLSVLLVMFSNSDNDC